MTDEFIEPIVLERNGEPVAPMRSGDGIIFFNFRSDRMRQIVRALTRPEFDAVAARLPPPAFVRSLGLLAALRLSGQPTDAVEEILRPEPVEADLDLAWAALKRDKKGEGVVVLLEGPGRPVVTTVPDDEARAALASLVRQ